MDWAIWAAPAGLGLVGLFTFLSGLVRFFKLKPVSGSGQALTGAALAAAGLATGLLGLNIQTYNRLSAEQTVAEISLRQKGPQEFVATLKTPDQQTQDYVIKGDQWSIEARVLKWKPWANVLGLDAMYKLDRLSGRYASVQDQTSILPTAYDLSPETEQVDMIEIAKTLGDFAPIAQDANYGSGTFLPMADGAVYTVKMSQSGLLARPANPVAEQAVEGKW